MDDLYLYCVTPAERKPADDLIGLDGEPVVAVIEGDLALWVSSVGAGRLEASIGAIRVHNAVVEAAMNRDVTPVPLRFGQRLDSPDAVRELMARERERWTGLLLLFRGALEVGLRVIDPARETTARLVHSPPAESGREYLEQVARRRARERGAIEEAERVASQVRQVLGPLFLREAVEPLRTPHGIASIAHLVEYVKLDEYRSRIARLRRSLPALRLLASGPWPPYSFVS
jgi:hypothetical protein